jgi:hypothetical protein
VPLPIICQGAVAVWAESVCLQCGKRPDVRDGLWLPFERASGGPYVYASESLVKRPLLPRVVRLPANEFNAAGGRRGCQGWPGMHDVAPVRNRLTARGVRST